MENKLAEKIERFEAQLPRWEKWLYACYSAAFILLAHGFVKAYENQTLINALSIVETKAGITRPSFFTPTPEFYYFSYINDAMISNWRIALWFVVQFFILACAAILVFHPAWRKIALAKRLDLIFGYLLAGWVTLLSLGAQNSLNAPNGYNTLVVVYLLALGLGYWQLRKRQARTEEVFP